MKYILSIIIVLFCSQTFADDNAREILQELIAKNDTIRTESYTLHTIERYEGGIKEKLMDVKLQRFPKKLYYKRHYPRKNLELYWNDEEYSMIKVRTNGFPNIKLNFDISDYKIRKNTRHILSDIGWNFIVNMIESLLVKPSSNCIITRLPDTSFNKIPSYHIELVQSDFHYIDYFTKAGDNTASIIQGKQINEYMLLEKNDTIKKYGTLDSGFSIKIPSAYAKNFSLLLSKENLDILKIESFDDIGLFESFEFTNIQLNLTFDHELFIMD